MRALSGGYEPACDQGRVRRGLLPVRLCGAGLLLRALLSARGWGNAMTRGLVRVRMGQPAGSPR